MKERNFFRILRIIPWQDVPTGIRTDMCSIRLDMVLPIRRSVILMHMQMSQIFGILEPVTVHVTVENTGTYPVQEAVQVYVRFSEREACDPGYQLKGIRSVALECGEKKEVCITPFPRDFALISEEGKCLGTPGSYEIAVGGQQPDERSSRLTGQTVSTLLYAKREM